MAVSGSALPPDVRKVSDLSTYALLVRAMPFSTESDRYPQTAAHLPQDISGHSPQERRMKSKGQRPSAHQGAEPGLN